jgi:hypothetical protein
MFAVSWWLAHEYGQSGCITLAAGRPRGPVAKYVCSVYAVNRGAVLVLQREWIIYQGLAWLEPMDGWF